MAPAKPPDPPVMMSAERPLPSRAPDPPPGVRMGPLAAYMSLALALSVQGGTVIWWAGVQNTRISQLEAQVDELQSSTPLTLRQLVDADRQIAVIDERIANILSRLEALTAALERLHDNR
jgi:hypothetical protein